MDTANTVTGTIPTGTTVGYVETTTTAIPEQPKQGTKVDVSALQAEIERLKNDRSKANSEAAEWKRKHNELLSEDEKKKQAEQEEIANMKAEIEQLRKEKTVSEYNAELSGLGFEKELADATAKALSDGDTKTFFKNLGTFKTALEAKIKAELMDNTPKPNGGSGDKPNPYVEQARNIGKTKAEADKKAADILSQYIKT